MNDTQFIWTSELNKRLLKLRYEHDSLFKKTRQPWREFYKILKKNNFPSNMSIDHVRKKWSYMYDTYKIAKRENNKHWKYYNLFEKIFAENNVLDKYNTWSDEWRIKLVTCIIEAKMLKLDFVNMWSTVEHALRCLDLPIECCIQDIKGLWHHLKMTFRRKYRVALKRGAEATAWPPYDVMLKYYQLFETDYLVKFENDSGEFVIKRESSGNNKNYSSNENIQNSEFQWSKHITESFIQIRFQNDWLFRQKKWAWSDLVNIMIEEYGFPKTLTSREISRKWAATFSDYQKAKATNNKSWVYYNIFELYLGEGNLSLNPLLGWEEEWVSNFISIRKDMEHLFKSSAEKDQVNGWREVEKSLRRIGLPLNHSLLQLPEIWTHLLKTFRWKKKFADKGILTEHWPYYEAMAHYEENKDKSTVARHKLEPEEDTYDDDYEDDIKLFDLKQKLETQLQPKFESLDGNQCRSCSNEDGSVNIFERRDDEGLNLADKLSMVCGVEVDITDKLPSQICLKCVKDLENAYKFRRKCQEIDKDYRNRAACNGKIMHTLSVCTIKLEHNENDNKQNVENADNDPKEETNRNDLDTDHFDDDYQPSIEKRKKPAVKKVTKKPPNIIKRKRTKKPRYVYTKVCEICGKHTQNLVAHLDMHSSTKMYSCDVCDKKFKFKSGLIIHKAVHDPTPRKTCEVCGKTFHIMAQYRRHFVYHANERKYECETCGKRFNTLDILRVHNRIHTDERPFPCSECGKTFRTAGCVSRHKRIVHRITNSSQAE